MTANELLYYQGMYDTIEAGYSLLFLITLATIIYKFCKLFRVPDLLKREDDNGS